MFTMQGTWLLWASAWGVRPLPSICGFKGSDFTSFVTRVMPSTFNALPKYDPNFVSQMMSKADYILSLVFWPTMSPSLEMPTQLFHPASHGVLFFSLMWSRFKHEGYLSRGWLCITNVFFHFVLDFLSRLNSNMDENDFLL